MGNLLTLHKDIKRHLVKNYLNKYDLLMLLWSVGIKNRLRRSFFSNAVYKGYLDLMIWTECNNNKVEKWIAMGWENQDWYTGRKVPKEPISYAAIKGDRIEVLEWISSRNPTCFKNHYKFAAGNGNLESLKWLQLTYYFNFKEVVEEAIANGHLNVLIWIKDEFPNVWRLFEENIDEDYDILSMIESSFDWGQFEIFKWLEKDYGHKIYGNIYIEDYDIYGDGGEEPGTLEIINYLKSKILKN